MIFPNSFLVKHNTITCPIEGGVIDDLIVYQLLDEKYLLVVNAANIEKDFNHIKKHSKKFDVKLENKSEKQLY